MNLGQIGPPLQVVAETKARRKARSTACALF